MSLLKHFLKEERGASLIEYSVLIGIISGLVIVIIAAVAAYMEGSWNTLNNELS